MIDEKFLRCSKEADEERATLLINGLRHQPPNNLSCFSPFLYYKRNAIERMSCRLKDFRRIATRYDRNATNFLAAVCSAATVSYWL